MKLTEIKNLIETAKKERVDLQDWDKQAPHFKGMGQHRYVVHKELSESSPLCCYCLRPLFWSLLKTNDKIKGLQSAILGTEGKNMMKYSTEKQRDKLEELEETVKKGFKQLQAIEDAEDIRDAKKALKRIKKDGGISLSEIKKDLKERMKKEKTRKLKL